MFILISNQRIQMKMIRYHFAPMRLQRWRPRESWVVVGIWYKTPQTLLAGEIGTAIVGRHLAQSDQIQDVKAHDPVIPF